MAVGCGSSVVVLAVGLKSPAGAGACVSGDDGDDTSALAASWSVKIIAVLTGHSESVKMVAVQQQMGGPGARRGLVASASQDGTACIWAVQLPRRPSNARALTTDADVADGSGGGDDGGDGGGATATCLEILADHDNEEPVNAVAFSGVCLGRCFS